MSSITCFLILFVLLFHLTSFSQKTKLNHETDSVSFITIIDTVLSTKDGMYLNGYVVNVGYEQGRKLHNKTVRISGKVTVEKALDKSELPIRQGREKDTKHIESPKIEILKN